MKNKKLKNKLELRGILAPIIIFALLQFPALTASAQRTIRVPFDRPSIQLAIDVASDADIVLVAPGVYFENLDFLGKPITVVSEQGPKVTVIDGSNKPNSPVVTFKTREGPASRLEGFTIRFGIAPVGGGIFVHLTSPTIIGNIFHDNKNSGGGFGAAIGGNIASPIVEGNTFFDNICDPVFLSGVVSIINDSSSEIVNNIFVNNRSCTAISFRHAHVNQVPHISNNTIVGNKGGIRARTISPSELYRNNIIVRNGTGLFVEGPTTASDIPSWKNNLVFENAINYDGGVADQTGKNGNISADPLFVNEAAGDYHLQTGSPAIDAGDNTVPPPLPDTDFEGDLRIVDGDGSGVATVDIGADEVDAVAEFPTRFAALDSQITLYKGHPGRDHFRAQGSFILGDLSRGIDPTADIVRFSVADASGRVFDQILPAGSFQPSSSNKGWIFRASAGSVGIRFMTIKPTNTVGRFKFEIVAEKLNLNAADKSPVTVSLRIRDDAGSQSLSCRVSKTVLKC